MITDSREDLTNSVAAAVKENKGKFRGLDCNRGTKTVMKRYVSNMQKNNSISPRNFACYFSVKL